jgi:hypothetical protein
MYNLDRVYRLKFAGVYPQMNPNAHKITGVICGYRVEEIEDPILQN